MRKVLEYSEFVSGESVLDKLIALERKWVDFQDEIYINSSIDQTKRRERIIKKYGGLLIDISRLVPLDSENPEEIVEELNQAADSVDIGYLVYYAVNYYLSLFTSYPNYTDITPIKWTEVK